MGGGLAGRHVRLKRRSGGAIATHSQERFVANCSDLRNRHCERSEAIHGATRGTNGLLRRFAPRNDGAPFSDTTPHSRGAMRPRFVKSFAQRREGAGNAGCLLHPRSRVQKCAKGRTRVYRYSRSIPAFPAQWFYGLWRALPGDEFLLPPSLANGWFAWPGRALQTSASLTPATGARTTRFCRTQPPDFALNRLRPKSDFGGSRGFAGHWRRSSAHCVRSRTRARPANTITRPTLPRPPHPAPTFVTMANAPLPGRDGASCKGDLG